MCRHINTVHLLPVFVESLYFLSDSLSAGLLRQATYTTTRLGIYTILFEKMTGADGRPPNFFLKVPHNSTRVTQLLLLANANSDSLCRP